MPFTFAHPAIVLPLSGIPARYISVTGLVLGSMCPDMEYFLRMRLIGTVGHTLQGLFWFNLPLGLLLTVLFHWIVRDALIDNLPAYFRKRFLVYKQQNWFPYFRGHWFTVSFSVLLGASSHLFWDGFTHQDTYFYNRMEWLRETLRILGYPVPLYKLLQHFSTLAGFLVIGLVIHFLPLTAAPKIKQPGRYWGMLAGLTIFFTVIRLLVLSAPLFRIGDLIVTVIGCGFLAVVVVSVFYKLREQKGKV